MKDTTEQDRRIGEAVRGERSRLLDFIRRRVPSEAEAEDLVQDVFYELTAAYRLLKPIEKLSSWLFQVARNKIADRYRKPTAISADLSVSVSADEEAETYLMADWLDSGAVSAEDEMMREIIMDAVAEALDELPAEQREVFVWHEIEDKSFREIAEMTGINTNTLLSRKRYAVLFLRERLQFLYGELFEN